MWTLNEGLIRDSNEERLRCGNVPPCDSHCDALRGRSRAASHESMGAVRPMATFRNRLAVTFSPQELCQRRLAGKTKVRTGQTQGAPREPPLRLFEKSTSSEKSPKSTVCSSRYLCDNFVRTKLTSAASKMTLFGERHHLTLVPGYRVGIRASQSTCLR